MAARSWNIRRPDAVLKSMLSRRLRVQHNPRQRQRYKRLNTRGNNPWFRLPSKQGDFEMRVHGSRDEKQDTEN